MALHPGGRWSVKTQINWTRPQPQPNKTTKHGCSMPLSRGCQLVPEELYCPLSSLTQDACVPSPLQSNSTTSRYQHPVHAVQVPAYGTHCLSRSTSHLTAGPHGAWNSMSQADCSLSSLLPTGGFPALDPEGSVWLLYPPLSELLWNNACSRPS